MAAPSADVFKLKELEALHSSHVREQEAMELSLLAAARDFDALSGSLYGRREQLISGDAEGNVPDFWACVLQRADCVNAVLSEADETILAFLLDVRASVCKDREAVKLTFKFAPNPYFKNTSLQREDCIETITMDGKDLRVSVASASAIEWLQRPDAGRNRKNKKGGGKKKGAKKVDDEEPAECESAVLGETGVILEYKTSFFAFFNPPNLKDLIGGGKKVELLASDPRLPKISQAILADREMQKSMWLDVVPRAALHYIACVDPPTYSCPMGLGLSNAAETTLENVLKVQQELDDLRATFAEKLRLIRAEFFTKRDEFARKRMGIIAPMVGEGLPLFWLTALRNTPHIWESFTDRDELALKFLTDIRWSYQDKRAGLSEPEDCDCFKEHPGRAFRLVLCFRDNPFFTNTELWVQCTNAGGQVTAKSSGVDWKPNKRFTVRKRDLPAEGAEATRYRTSFFLLFEATSSAKGAAGLWDAHEKLSLARVLKDEVVPQAVRLFALDPDNNGCDAELDSDEDTLDSDDIGSDTSEGEEEEEEDDSGSESDEDAPRTLQERAEAAAKKRKTKGSDGMMKKMLGSSGRDPCVMFVMFLMASNLLIGLISFFIDL